MNHIPIRRHSFQLHPTHDRVLFRSYTPEDGSLQSMIQRILSFSDEEVLQQIQEVIREFGERHYNLESQLLKVFRDLKNRISSSDTIGRERQILIGAYFSREYALESAALFNPSIVAHPDQSSAPEGGLRFIMSLRATGELHISSVEFRTGTILASGDIDFDAVSPKVSHPEVVENPICSKQNYFSKLEEMGAEGKLINEALASLEATFSLNDLKQQLHNLQVNASQSGDTFARAFEYIDWLADSNYEIRFSDNLAMSERVIYPVSKHENKGIEDVRFVRLEEDDGSVAYYGTYTAYDGHNILSKLIQTTDFQTHKIFTLGGEGVKDKGMALFPRRINGRYAMLSRQDDQNLLIMFSENLYHWENPEVILRPEQPWESGKIGNCGSPIETEAGWLVITHGVGPMRKYGIGAALLDLDDPTKVIGRLEYPIIVAGSEEREGYVPNVVYSCGSMLHGQTLVIPYAICDLTTVIATLPLMDLLDALQRQ